MARGILHDHNAGAARAASQIEGGVIVAATAAAAARICGPGCTGIVGSPAGAAASGATRSARAKANSCSAAATAGIDH